MGRLVDIQTAQNVYKKSEKIDTHFYDHFCTNWIIYNDEPPRPDRNALWRLISLKVWKIRTWNCNTIFTQLSNLCYQILELISLIVWKLWAFPQRSNLLLNHTNYVLCKGLKIYNATCSLVLCRGFLNPCAILVNIMG